jgi:crotonobetainyl-CoA:carnitine CoA-transferase CaiB-like acyl-CoA transferase
MRLGDLGADVLKIEPPGIGEFNRTHGFGDLGMNGETTTFLGLNRNKRSVAINLKSPAGIAALHDLVRVSDVFLQNYRVGTAERLGVGYEQLRAINPRLIYCSISGYGEEGPYAGRPGQDLVIQCYSGSMWSVGRAGDAPTPSALWAADAITGYQAAIGILGALQARQRTGAGQKVHVAMLAAIMDCQMQELTTHLNLGLVPERPQTPSAHAWLPAPYGVYPTADGYITLAMAPLTVLGEALGIPRLADFGAWNDGMEHRDEIWTLVAARMPDRTTAEWIEILDAHKLWSGPVYRYPDLVNDPHVVATGMIATVDHPTAGPVRVPAPPIRMSETPTGIHRAPPLLGQHTDEVLRDVLGYGDDQVEAMRAGGAI